MVRLGLGTVGAAFVYLAGMLAAYTLESWLPLEGAATTLLDRFITSSAVIVAAVTGGMEPFSALIISMALGSAGIFGLLGAFLWNWFMD